MNENLRQALLRAHLREQDVAASLGVDPKTVRRWIEGRVPYPANRAAVADLVRMDEADLWPKVSSPLNQRIGPSELRTVYPHRWAIPRDTWVRLFAAAENEIGILAYSALFLAEDSGLRGIINNKGHSGVPVRIILGEPDSPHVAQRGVEEGIGDAMGAKVRNAIALWISQGPHPNISLRLHNAVLYTSIYFVDQHIIVNPHVYGTPAAQAPAFYLLRSEYGGMSSEYLESFERIWADASPSRP